MSLSIFDFRGPHPEPSSMTAFAAGDLDRGAEHRKDDCTDQALAIDGAHILAFSGKSLVLKHDDHVLDPLFAPYELSDLEPDYANAILLGYRKSGEPRLAVPLGLGEEAVSEHYKLVDARTLWRDGLLSSDLEGEFAQAASLIAWNADNRFCGRCGGKMEIRIGGYKRVCMACNAMIFPRTDPVVIMMTVDIERDRCLLGRGPHFTPGMYSCLAGFVEPGETIENAVRRETLEESGIRTGRVRYHASQPWPMPHSLMIGCYAEAISTEIVRDEAELEDCRWFTRDEITAMLERAPGEDYSAPNTGAIAHRLIRDWVDWPR